MNVPDSKQQEMLARQRCEQVGSVIMLAAYFPVSVYINLLCLYLKVFSYMHIVLYCIFKPSLPYEVRCQRLAYTFCMLCLCISPSVHLWLYVSTISLLSMDFCQTFVIGAPCDRDEPIRF